MNSRRRRRLATIIGTTMLICMLANGLAAFAHAALTLWFSPDTAAYDELNLSPLGMLTLPVTAALAAGVPCALMCCPVAWWVLRRRHLQGLWKQPAMLCLFAGAGGGGLAAYTGYNEEFLLSPFQVISVLLIAAMFHFACWVVARGHHRWVVDMQYPFCPTCRYDVRHNASTRCPECGFELCISDPAARTELDRIIAEDVPVFVSKYANGAMIIEARLGRHSLYAWGRNAAVVIAGIRDQVDSLRAALTEARHGRVRFWWRQRPAASTPAEADDAQGVAAHPASTDDRGGS